MFKDTICLNTKILHFICNVQLKDAQIFRKYRFYRKTLVIRMMTWRKFNFEYSITLETAVRNSNPTATWSPGIVHFWYDNSRWMITMTVIRPMYLYISRLIKTCSPLLSTIQMQVVSFIRLLLMNWIVIRRKYEGLCQWIRINVAFFLSICECFLFVYEQEDKAVTLRARGAQRVPGS